MKLPPYGRELASRLKFGNSPFHVVLCVGLDDWQRAREWNACPNDVHTLVLPAGADPNWFRWPVAGQLVVIDVACGPSDADLRNLADVLLAYGAETVTVKSRDGLNTFKKYVPEGRGAA